MDRRRALTARLTGNSFANMIWWVCHQIPIQGYTWNKVGSTRPGMPMNFTGREIHQQLWVISTVVTETWFSFGKDVRIAFAIRVCKPGHHFRSCVSLQFFQNNYNYLHSVVGCWWSIPALVSSACTVGSSNPRRCQWFQSETYLQIIQAWYLAKSEKLALFYHTSRLTSKKAFCFQSKPRIAGR